jgi:SAM-dependent methyltransferase
MITRCPLCSGDGVSVVHQRLTPVLMYAPAGRAPSKEDLAPLTVARCSDCGHLYNRAFDESFLPRMYGDNPLTNVPVDPSMIERLAGLADWVGEEHYGGKRVLEIGGGSGHFAYTLAQKAQGVTIFEPCLRLSAGELGLANISVINRTFPDGHTIDLVDFICCRQVVEHVVSPIDLLDAIRAALRPGGSAYIEIPSADFIERHASPIDLCLQHVHYFSEANFRALLQRAHFIVERKLEIKNGHDVGFLVRAGVATAATGNHGGAVDDLAGRVASRLAMARSRLQAVAGRVALYGANSYGQAFLDLWPEIEIAAVFDDNADLASYTLCGGTRSVVIELPARERVAAIDTVIIAAYLHDEVIARKLRQQGYAGRILSLRPSPLTPSPDRVEPVLV